MFLILLLCSVIAPIVPLSEMLKLSLIEGRLCIGAGPLLGYFGKRTEITWEEKEEKVL